jgi:hypothetical protein
MKQTSLLSFIKSGSGTGTLHAPTSSSSSFPPTTSYDLPYPYFYLQWNDKKPKLQAHFLKEKPKLCNFKKSIFWKDANMELILCGHFEHLRDIDIQDPTTYKHLYKLDKEKKYKNVGLLKSLLQKAIRRKDINVAVKCAFHYMTLDIQDFLRRLPIIMIEDTCIHEIFPTLVWFMIASTIPDFIFDKVIYEYLMGSVYVIAGIPIYHSLNKTYKKESKVGEKDHYEKYNSILPLLSLSNSKDQSIQSLVYSLLLRKAYGGMLGDMKMLEEYAYYWSFQEKEHNYLMKIPIRPIMLASIQPLQLSEWILEAIDFHCTPQIIEYIHEEYPEYNKEYIQDLIWYNSSKINMRIKNKPYEEDDWNKIKHYVKRVQHYLLEEKY